MSGMALTATIAAVATLLTLSPRPAEALPSFARQTGTACGACHTDFPQLTPFGRRFKLGGYTMGGGQNTAEYKKVFGSNQWVPPISVMGIASFTKTSAAQTDSNGLPMNNVFSADQASIFYGGAITNEIGAFVQGTLAGGTFSLDNADVRYAKTGSFFGSSAIYGITAHNSPTVQDVWNTTSVWGFPFVESGVAPGPAAATMIEGNFAGKVLGVGAYTFINDIFYLEATAYKGLTTKWQSKLGVSEGMENPNAYMDKVSPYVRVAVEPHWGNHWLQVGAFWLSTSTNPQVVNPVDFGTSGSSNKFVDVGVDSQYQYMGKNYVFTTRASYIHEKQTLDGHLANTESTNPTNTLNSLKAQASLAWNTDAPGNKWVFTGGYFNTWGTADALLYIDHVTGSPNSDGWIAEIAWFPYAMSKSSPWPYFNARVGLQYKWYNKFNGASTNYDGAGRNASDNNTLFAYLWFSL